MVDKKNWSLYIIECKDRSLYCGITNNLEKRLILHKTGKASRYTRGRLPVKLVHSEKNLTRSEALKKEIKIKKLPKMRKREYIKTKGRRFRFEL